ncbi:MAG: bifunctional 2-polyprenyl-6-hydroxyphenol methylase/3-demethylubiquinol 3-O-methyltransferase UbiG [Rickettsiaceae bacterium]|nr:bifunctional 2-polyprenyl-6-hydroxyphenol methylase/3-demethylubiquinol 3-O-methyltransferase UbiG [Rickettsiaceae bacterium]
MKNSSLDQTELSKFAKDYQQWWDLDGEFRTLHQINPLRKQYITAKITQHFKIKTTDSKALAKLEVVDVGCGGGILTSEIAKLGVRITGIDANIKAINAAKEHAIKHRLPINYQLSTVEEHCQNKQQYDVVICLELIEHVANTAEFITNLAKLIKPGGMMILSTLNKNLKSYVQAIFIAEYVLGWLDKGTHDYSKFVKPSKLQAMLEPTNLQIKELQGLSYKITNKEWYLSDNVDVNYLAFIA